MNYFLTLCSLLAFAGALALVGPTPADDQKRDDTKTVRLVLKGVRVEPANKDGKAWDVNDGKPDLVVRITDLSDSSIKTFESEEKADTLEAIFNRDTILVSPGQRLQIEVIDKDLAAHDMIGKTTIQVTDDMLKKGKLEMSFEQVQNLGLEFKK